MAQNKKNKKAQKGSRAAVKSLPVVADGYIERQTTDGKTYIVPKFMIEDFESKQDAHQKKNQVQLLRSSTGNTPSSQGAAHYICVDNGSAAQNGIPHNMDIFDRITELGIKFPPDPALSEHDILEQHAEVMSLRDRLGISYKDACHRLYIAELERLKAEQDSLFGLERTEQSIEDALSMVADVARMDGNNVV